jgi:enoyl-CoA hydratase/carnithine racemase
MDAMQNDVLAEVRNHIGHLTLNRPTGLNALTLDMVRTLQRHLDAWAQDPQVHAVVLRGAGEKAFCAGGIRSLYDSFKTATPCIKTSSSRNTPLTSRSTITANRCWP